MRLLKRDSSDESSTLIRFSLTNFPSSSIPAVYAIVSHRWGDDEVTLNDLELGTAETRNGYRKLEFCANRAALDGIVYFWIDTCCIDRRNNTELSEAINSMFKWYQNATKCYVYLPDVALETDTNVSSTESAWASSFQSSTWFTRGWTLQELIAPKAVEFFSVEGKRLGDKTSLEQQIHKVTKLPVEVLRGSSFAQFNIDERFTWAAERHTMVEEDAAYCLLGLFDVHMPLIYGEGRQKALARLRRKAEKFSQPASSNSANAKWIVPFERNSRFIGRDAELAKMEANLFAHDYTTRWAIVGLGGVGKTQLVLELLHRTKAKYPDCMMLWIPATSSESLHQGYAIIAQQLEIPGCEDQNKDVRSLVQDYLTKINVARWLLVFDNADDIDLWTSASISSSQEHISDSLGKPNRLIDCLPRSKQGCIIFTTRDRKAATKLAGPNIMPVSELDEHSAIGLLSNYLGASTVSEHRLDVTKLLTELTHLPLAIVQAATYIIENGITVAEYLRLLEEKEEEVIGLLSEDFEDLGRYRESKNPVATTWLISFEQIQQRDRLAVEYLSYMACVHPKDIPRSFLPQSSSRRRESEAIGTLTAYSFVSRRAVDDMLSLHRLVHLATRNWLRKERLLSPWLEKTIIRLEEVLPERDHTNRTVWRTYLPHVLQVLESNEFHKGWTQETALMGKCAQCLSLDGKWKEAESWLVLLLTRKETILTGNDLFTLSCKAHLASIYDQQGRWSEAEELQLQVVKGYRAQLGDNNPRTLNETADLANIYTRQGKWTEAEELHVQVRKMNEATFGLDHLNTLRSMEKLGHLYIPQGRWSEGEEILLRVKEGYEAKLGSDHVQTVDVMGVLGVIYYYLRRLKEAEALQVQVNEWCQTRLEAEDPQTMFGKVNLATTYSTQGRLKEAEELQVQVLKWAKMKLGENHPDTLTSIMNLAATYWKQGRLTEAEDLEVQLLHTRRANLGANHPDTLLSMSNLARTWKTQGKHSQAVELMRDAVQRQSQIFGVQHPELISSSNSLRNWEAE